MYTDLEMKIILQDNDPYRDADGNKYPGNFPKEEIDSLIKVIETPRPSGENLVVTGFSIIDKNGEPTQVWNTREKTDQEKVLELKQKAMVALNESDMVALRCFKAGVEFGEDWKEYVYNLRAVYNGFSGYMPEKPEYPKGS